MKSRVISQKVDPPLSNRQKRKLKTRYFEEGTKNTYEKIKADEKTDIKNTIQVEQNDEPEDGEQNDDNMLVDEKNGDYLTEEQKNSTMGCFSSRTINT
ncbi:UNVERIFIED_CONTAM: hypothetical protein NCL1_57051 [Trichonephila clavipes]